MLYEILKAAKTGIAPDMYTALFASKLKNAKGAVRVLSGVPPLNFRSNGQPLIEYEIYGNMQQSGGCGERTANLFDCNYVNAYVDAAQYKFVNVNTNAISAVIEVEPNTTYTVKKYDTSNRFLIGSAASVPTLNTPLSMINTDNEKTEVTFTTESSTNYIVVYVSTGAEHATPRLMLNIDSTALPYEPYGYKIPIVLNGMTYPIYIAVPLRKSLDGSNVYDEISSSGTLIRRVDANGDALATPTTEIITAPAIPTVSGNNTLDVDTIIKPSKVSIKYKGR